MTLINKKNTKVQYLTSNQLKKKKKTKAACFSTHKMGSHHLRIQGSAEYVSAVLASALHPPRSNTKVPFSSPSILEAFLEPFYTHQPNFRPPSSNETLTQPSCIPAFPTASRKTHLPRALGSPPRLPAPLIQSQGERRNPDSRTS